MVKQVIDPQRLEDLRQALARIDPEARKSWQLEIYDRRDGEDRLTAVIDIKTGQPIRAGQAKKRSTKAGV